MHDVEKVWSQQWGRSQENIRYAVHHLTPTALQRVIEYCLRIFWQKLFDQPHYNLYGVTFGRLRQDGLLVVRTFAQQWWTGGEGVVARWTSIIVLPQGVLRSRMRRLARCLALAGGVLALPPMSARGADQPTHRVVVIYTGQHTYRVPYLYLSIRPPLEALEPVNSWRRFSFAFWMPDGRPSLRAGHEAGTPRPQEPGRLPPGPDDYLFVVTHVAAWAGPDAVPRPGEQLENVFRIPGTQAYEYRERWGMIEITPRPGQPAHSDRYFGARYFRDVPIEASALMDCPREGTPGNNRYTMHRLCTGTVALRRLEVTFAVQIPMERMDQFMDAVGVAARLLAGWSDVDLNR